MNLLPQPRRIDVLPGRLEPAGFLRLTREVDDPRLLRLAAEHNAPGGPDESSREPVRHVRVSIVPGELPHRDGYRLSVRPEGVDIVGGSPAGCFYAWQTLRGLFLQTGPNPANASLPCCDITDWPDFDTRGLLLDVTRGKVPTLETLLMIADRLAALKINQLQLYIEHAFAFAFDPEICPPEGGLTPDEVGALDAYCRERFIDLVPAVATFGHMGRILSMPKYRHLAEIEATTVWEQMGWPQRVRGLTLDCTNPEAHALVERLWSDILDAFSGPVVNICGDEPWDLGRGKSRARLGGNIGEAYLEHIRRTHELCARRGRRTQFWSDVVRNHPHLLDRVPPEATVLHWGYDDRTHYAAAAEFVRAELTTFVCPGTSGWKRLIPAMNLAERNIATFARIGRECGATGLINTDWGDHGHFNLLACSLHGIATGACRAWRADHPGGSEFDRTFARRVLGLPDGAVVRSLREASQLGEACETWRLLWTRLADAAMDPTLPTLEAAAECAEAAKRARTMLAPATAADETRNADLEEINTACLFQALFVHRIALIHESRRRGRCNAYGGRDRQAFREQWTDATAQFTACWRRRNKGSGLDEILSALARTASELTESESTALPLEP